MRNSGIFAAVRSRWQRTGHWGRDFEFARRRLLRSRLFVVATLGTLTMGLGAFAVVYTAVALGASYGRMLRLMHAAGSPDSRSAGRRLAVGPVHALGCSIRPAPRQRFCLLRAGATCVEDRSRPTASAGLNLTNQMQFWGETEIERFLQLRS
jgi:hypothetical protein